MKWTSQTNAWLADMASARAHRIGSKGLCRRNEAATGRREGAEQGMRGDRKYLSTRVRAPDRGSACVDPAPEIHGMRERRHERQRRWVPSAPALLFGVAVVLLFSHTPPLVSAATVSKEAGELPVSDSYSSYLWRRAEAIWEAATGELPSPSAGHVPTLADTGSSAGDGETSDSDASASASSSTTSPSESPLLHSHPDNTSGDDEGEPMTTLQYAHDAGQLTGVDLGRHLLHDQGDAAGAEQVCLEALHACAGTGSSEDRTTMQRTKAEALTCLGETGLALHQSSYAKAQSARVGSVAHGLYLSQSLDKLRSARAALDEAVLLDPTHAQARLGVGTAMMLTATRRGDIDGTTNTRKQREDDNHEDSAAQLLFGATQHLEAAVRMTTTLLDASASPPSPPSSSSLLISLHNLALAHMALGDASSAVIPMQKAAAELLRQSATPSSALGVTEQTNLGSAMVQAGMVEEGVQILEGIESKFCQKSGNSGGSKSSSLLRLCSIVYNNLGIAHEIKASDNERGLGVDEPSEEAGNAIVVSMTEEYYHSSVAASPNAFNAYNRDALSETEREESTDTHQDGSSESGLKNISDHWKAAIDALEVIVRQNPDNSRSWVSLSKARNRAGDHAGALNAAAEGVSTAKGKDEMSLANSALEDALSGIDANESSGSGSETALAHPTTMFSVDSTSPAEVRALRLEQEVLSLKFQLLEQRMGGKFVPQHSGSMPEQHHDAWGASFVHEDEERHFAPDKVSAPSASDSQLNSIDDVREDIVSPTLPGQDKMAADGNPESAATNEASSVKEEEDTIEEQAIREDEHTAVSGEGIKTEDSEVADSTDITEEEEEEPPQQNVIYGTGDDEGLEIGEERSIGDPDDEIVVETETIVTRKVEEEPRAKTADEKVQEEADQEAEPKVELPNLYKPPISQSPPELSAIVPSLMKLSDAYMQKENYPLAQKQFKKVLKKAPLHIPALLGYATAIERSGNPKKILEAALAYGNATKAALGVGDDRLATIALRRATSLCSSASSSSKDKLNTLRSLAELAFTGDLASEIYYAIGSESMESASDGEENPESSNDEVAVNAFKIANGFACLGHDASAECHGHGKSLSRLARLTLDGDAKESLRYASAALKTDIEDETKIEAHVVAGQAKMVCCVPD